MNCSCERSPFKRKPFERTPCERSSSLREREKSDTRLQVNIVECLSFQENERLVETIVIFTNKSKLSAAHFS